MQYLTELLMSCPLHANVFCQTDTTPLMLSASKLALRHVFQQKVYDYHLAAYSNRVTRYAAVSVLRGGQQETYVKREAFMGDLQFS